MCVESVTTGSPQHARILSRSGRRGGCGSILARCAEPCDADKCANGSRPPFFFWPGVRLEVTRRAGSSKRSNSRIINSDERSERGRNREDTKRGRASIAIHPLERMTSEQAWDLFPKPPRFQHASDFGGQQLPN